jgi:spermidine/putrescine transport system substrate-binding protein
MHGLYRLAGIPNAPSAYNPLVNPDLVVPDSVTKGEIIQNVSAEADEAYNKNWTEFKAACGQ